MAEALSRLVPNDDCRLILVIRHRQVTEPHPATSHKEKINGVTFDVFGVGGVAAGNLLAADAYRSVHQNRCYELSVRVAFANIANFDPGAVKEFDYELVHRSLKSVLDTFKFLALSRDW